MATPKLGRIFQRKWKRPDGTVELLPTLWIEWYDREGRQHRESTGDTSVRKAEKLLKEKHAITERQTPGAEKTMVVELLDDLLADYEQNGKSIKWAKIVDKHLRAHFRYYKAAKVDTSAIRDYVNSRRAKSIAYSTINRELALLRRAYNLGIAAEPPKVTRAPRIKAFREDNIRKGFFEHEEFLAMRAALPQELRPVITFAYYTGCRRGEILRIQWSQVDLRGKVIRLEAGETKNKQPRILPLYGELLQVVQMQADVRKELWPRCRFLFFRNGEQIKSFKGAWEAACTATGIDRHFHDLRRTGVRNLVRSGVPEKVAMRISGHKTRSVFDRYNIVDERDLHIAAQKLDAYISGKSQVVAEKPEKRQGKVM